MRKLTFKTHVETETFRPLTFIYLDDVKTGVSFCREEISEAIAWHGKIVLDDIPKMLIEELKDNNNNITDEEEIQYKKIFGGLF